MIQHLKRSKAPLPPAPLPDNLPACPITGTPARRRVQKISVKLLESLWRIGLGIDVSRLLSGNKSIGLYESGCGLFFFEPRIGGDERFYVDFWRRVARLDMDDHVMTRMEFRRAAAHIPNGAALLDVGCGRGTFHRHVTHAGYRGLDPSAPGDADPAVVRETLSAHAERFPQAYDVVTAFQVIEHVPDPRGFTELLLRALKPGGLLILCAPLHPSPLTEIPNLLINAPPHHLTWWSKRAFEALAHGCRLEPLEIGEIACSPHEGWVHWVRKFSLFRAKPGDVECYFAHRWSWHVNLALSFVFAKIVFAFKPLPSHPRPTNVFFVARKTG
jgi:SAM-dependent methyltransferase